MATSRLAQARDAVRPALKARLMISGPTGAGKTWTALKIAEVLAEGGKILVIDTEKESALTYADNFSFVHLPWLPPFEPRELARTMAEAGHEYAVVIVDSTSHFWRKEGGTLDIAGGKFTGWKDARPAQEDLVQALLDCHAHVILCTRSKMEHVQEEINGRHVVRKVGMAPQQDDDLEYELNISIEMDMDHRATVAKSRADAVQVGRSFTAGHEVELAALYADWLKGGEPPAPQPVVDDLVARMNALPPAVRPVCKREFVQAFGRPDGLRECRAPEAEALVARFEAVESHSLPVEEPTTPTASAHGAGDGDDKGTDDGTREGVGETLTVPEVSGGGESVPPPTAAPDVHTGGLSASAETPPSGVSPVPGGEGQDASAPSQSVAAAEQTPSGPDTPTAAVLLAATGKTAGSAVVALKRAAAEVDPDGPFMAEEIEADPVFAARVLAHLGGMPTEGTPVATYSKKQNGWIHAVWANHGGDNARKAYISQLTSGRTDSSGELTAAEKKAYLAKTEEMA